MLKILRVKLMLCQWSNNLNFSNDFYNMILYFLQILYMYIFIISISHFLQLYMQNLNICILVWTRLKRKRRRACKAKRRPDPSRPANKGELNKYASANATNNKNTFNEWETRTNSLSNLLSFWELDKAFNIHLCFYIYFNLHSSVKSQIFKL